MNDDDTGTTDADGGTGTKADDLRPSTIVGCLKVGLAKFVTSRGSQPAFSFLMNGYF